MTKDIFEKALQDKVLKLKNLFEAQDKLLDIYRKIYLNIFLANHPTHWEHLIIEKNKLEDELKGLRKSIS